jgi:hypothetical protein
MASPKALLRQPCHTACVHVKERGQVDTAAKFAIIQPDKREVSGANNPTKDVLNALHPWKIPLMGQNRTAACARAATNQKHGKRLAYYRSIRLCIALPIL